MSKNKSLRPAAIIYFKGTIINVGLLTIAVCIAAIYPVLFLDKMGEYRLIVIGMYIAAIPFLFALFHAWRLTSNVSKHKTFTASSIKELTYIKYALFSITVLYVLLIPYVYILADQHDAFGIMTGPILIAVASFIGVMIVSRFQDRIKNSLTRK